MNGIIIGICWLFIVLIILTGLMFITTILAILTGIFSFFEGRDE